MLSRGVTAAVVGIIILTSALAAPAAAAGKARAHPNTSDHERVAAQLRAGTLSTGHAVTNRCLAPVGDKLVRLGCQSLVVTQSKTSSTPMTTAVPAGYGPAELESAFSLPAASVGAHNAVTIIAVGAYPKLESDLATYRAQYGLPACTTANGCLKIVDYHGGAPVTPDSSLASVEESYATETALDVDMASAGCPTCKINVVQIPMNLVKLLNAATLQMPGQLADDFGTAVNEAVALHSSAVSISYGLPTGLQADYVGTGSPAKALHHPGTAIVASSGDSGYTGSRQLWPQELPWVTSAGGVTLKHTNGNYTMSAWGGVFTAKGSSTSKWAGAGSGCALDLPAAVGQPAAVSAHCSGHRAASDVSADADPYTGVAVYDTYTPNSGSGGGWLVVGGTSAAAPFLAGLYARAGHLSAVDGPNTMYSAPAGTITDVVGGTNAQNGSSACGQFGTAVCTGVAGWDGPTGVGVPKGLGAF